MAKLASTTIYGNLNVLETANVVQELQVNNGETFKVNSDEIKYKNKNVVTVDGAANTTFDINVASANKWKTPRTLSFTGDATGTGTIDGSGNVSIAMTHRDTSTQASITSTIPTMIQNITLDGMGHVTGLTTYNLDSRYYTETEINTQMNNKVNITHTINTGTGLNGGGNLTAGRTIAHNTGNAWNHIPADGVSGQYLKWNGLGEASWFTPATLTRGAYLTGSNYSPNSASTIAVDATTTPTASKIVARTSDADIEARLFKSNYANQTTVSGALAFRTNNTTDNYIRFCSDVTAIKTWLGLQNVNNTADSAKNVLSATKLTTARTIGGVSFDGTANINLPGVNTAGNQSTSGNAASATVLQTARTINGTSFNGSANITTANWGTARNLQIGNTAKSVNGSGNITWSVAEIGAVNKAGDTMTGDLTMRNNSSSWISGKSGALISNTVNTSSYSPMLRQIHESHTFNIGGLGNGQFGIYRFTNTTTENRTDSSFHMNTSGNMIGTGALSMSGTITGSKVYNAVLNDYAELFPKLESTITEEGDIIALSETEDNEVYELATSNHCLIIGVHSGEFAHLIGGNEAPEGEDFYEFNKKDHIPVGLAGRVHVKFIGVAKKGMKVVPSDIAGVGKQFDPKTDNYDQVIGYIVENNPNEEIKKVKIKIGK